MNQSTPATYTQKPYHRAKGNPLIEALPDPLEPKEFTRQTEFRLQAPEDLLEKPDFWRKLAIHDLPHTYMPDPQLLSLYNAILIAVYAGYGHRNPLSREGQRFQYEVATNPEYKVPERFLPNVIPFLGLSGSGKTLGIMKCLQTIPQVIRHETYKDQSFKQDQLLYLYFQVAGSKKQRGFLANYFYAIDQVLGTDYFGEHYSAKATVSDMLINARKIAVRHCIGIVFVDELQRCASSSNNAEVTTLNFIETFFCNIGIPAVCAGTYGASPLFEDNMSLARRLSSGQAFDFGRPSPKSGHWQRLVQSFHYPEFLRKSFTFDESFVELVYELTQGLPAILARLMRLSYEFAIDTGHERIDGEFVSEVFRAQFDLLKPALASLRSGNLADFEDLSRPSGHFSTFTDEVLGLEEAREFERKVAEEIDGEEFIELDEESTAVLETKDDVCQLQDLSRDDIEAVLRQRLAR